MVKITLDISYEQLKQIIDMLPKNKLCNLCSNVVRWKNKRKRINNIKEYLLTNVPETKIRQEVLFNRLKVKGYPLSRKTFVRDINNLESEGIISKKVITGGKHGSTTYLTIINNEVKQR